MTRAILAVGTICAVVWSAMVRTETQAPPPAAPTFSKDLAPILLDTKPASSTAGDQKP